MPETGAARAADPSRPQASSPAPVGVVVPQRDQVVPTTRPGAGVAGRRTVTIQGRGADRYYPPRRRQDARRPPMPRYQRSGFRADKTAIWAVALCLLMVLMAAASAHAAVLY